MEAPMEKRHLQVAPSVDSLPSYQGGAVVRREGTDRSCRKWLARVGQLAIEVVAAAGRNYEAPSNAAVDEVRELVDELWGQSLRFTIRPRRRSK